MLGPPCSAPTPHSDARTAGRRMRPDAIMASDACSCCGGGAGKGHAQTEGQSLEPLTRAGRRGGSAAPNADTIRGAEDFARLGRVQLSPK
eukprot:scaffold207_cov409-Prasinococcus_capsulatus_cf.AAC.109